MHPIRRLLAAALLTLAIPLIAACSDLAADSPLAHARRSPEALADAGLAALIAGDRDGLQALLVDRDEYERLLWPLLPDRHQVDFDFVWGMSAPRNRKALNNLLSDYEGLGMEVVSVDLGAVVETYEGMTLYKDARMTVRRTDTGAEGVLPMMDVVVEMGGGWKFLNFRDDV